MMPLHNFPMQPTAHTYPSPPAPCHYPSDKSLRGCPQGERTLSFSWLGLGAAKGVAKRIVDVTCSVIQSRLRQGFLEWQVSPQVPIWDGLIQGYVLGSPSPVHKIKSLQPGASPQRTGFKELGGHTRYLLLDNAFGKVTRGRASSKYQPFETPWSQHWPQKKG